MPILRLHSIFPILESLYGRIPSLICIEIINLKNHSWQVSWNVKADIIIIIMVTYRHAVPRKKRTDFNLSATRKPKFLVMPKASSAASGPISILPRGITCFFFQCQILHLALSFDKFDAATTLKGNEFFWFAFLKPELLCLI